MISFQSYYLLKWKGGDETLLESWEGAVTPAKGVDSFSQLFNPTMPQQAEGEACLLRQLVPRC